MTSVVTLKDMLAVTPLIALLVFSLIPLMMKVFSGNKEPQRFVTVSYALLGVIFALGLTISLSGMRHSAFTDTFIFDGMSVWGFVIILFCGAAAIGMAYDHVETDRNQFSEQCFLISGSMIGMMTLIGANDLIITFLGIEMMSLCLYILVALSREQTLSKEASFKYFILGSFASAIFLYGVSFIYGTVGSANIAIMANKVSLMMSSHNQLFYIGLFMLVVGFAFKVSAFPLHSWAPDVYQGAATPITAFMATAVKTATFIAVMRVFQHADITGPSAFLSEPKFLSVMSWLAALTMLIGNAAGVIQDNFKRLLAYSSISHAGYILVGIITVGFAQKIESSVAASTVVLFYLFSYSIMTVGAFALIAILEKHVGHALMIDDLKGLSTKHPAIAAALAIILFSLAGVPPTIGFFAKFSLFGAAIDQDLYWLAFWGVLSSVISVFYYLRPVVAMYMAESTAQFEVRDGILTRATLFITAVATIVFGLAASPILELVSQSILKRLS